MCKVTMCIRFFGQLGCDICSFAVNLVLFPLYSRDAITNSSPQAHALTTQCFRERIVSLLFKTFVDNRTQFLHAFWGVS